MLQAKNKLHSNLKSGGNHSCHIDPFSGRMTCWGWNKYGQVEVPEMFLDDTLQMALGASHTCALDSPVQHKQHNVNKTYETLPHTNDLLRCWGWNQ